MPYQTIKIEAPLFMEHAGVQIYQTYVNDDIDRPDRFSFTTDKEATDNDDVLAFDVRGLEVPAAKELTSKKPAAFTSSLRPDRWSSDPDYLAYVIACHNWFEVEEPALIREAIVQAIDKGLVQMNYPNCLAYPTPLNSTFHTGTKKQ